MADTPPQPDTASTPPRTRKRKPSAAAQERRAQIIAAAVEVINQRGANGMSLQTVANKVGITQAGVLHYMGSKNGLLFEVVQHYYDRSSSAEDYLSLFEEGGALYGQQPKIPEYCRLIVAENAGQPEMVRLFQTLNTEAMSPESPLHDYFAERSRGISDPIEDQGWLVPAGVDARVTFSVAMAAIYGLEGRWLARPDDIDYQAEWARFEDVLFPLPTWEGYR